MEFVRHVKDVILCITKKQVVYFQNVQAKKMPINNLNYYVQSCSILISKSIQNLEEDEPFVREKYKFIYTYRQQ
jgi:hypothetical protein